MQFRVSTVLTFGWTENKKAIWRCYLSFGNMTLEHYDGRFSLFSEVLLTELTQLIGLQRI